MEGVSISPDKEQPYVPISRADIIDIRQKFEANERQIFRLSNHVAQISKRFVECEQDFLHQKESWVSAQRERDPVAEIQELKVSNERLRKERDACRRLIKIMRTPMKPLEHRSLDKFKVEMDYLEDSCGQMFNFYSGPPPRNPGEGSWGPDTEELLVRQILAVKPGISLRDFLADFTANLDLTSLLQALIAAALQKWVFESDFPNCDFERSLLLEVYRSYIVQQPGMST